jgi:hypothetical protein
VPVNIPYLKDVLRAAFKMMFYDPARSKEVPLRSTASVDITGVRVKTDVYPQIREAIGRELGTNHGG